MGGVDVPDTPVGVVVAVGAGTERALSPERRGAPVIVVVTRNKVRREEGGNCVT